MSQEPGGIGATIDRSSPLPFYSQLKQIIVAEIGRQGLAPGDRFMGDHELCERYDVSRTVVRQALAELEAEGVVDRVKGRGTFIAPKKTDEGLVRSLTGLYQDVAQRGSSLRSEVRRQEVVPADDQVAATLGIALSTPVIIVERLRFVDDEPWVLTITHVPEASAPGLVHDDLTEQSLYLLLQNSYGLEIASGKRTVEASIASTRLARDLGINKGDPILVLRSVVFDSTGKPVEMFVAYHRGDRSRFEVALGAPAGDASTPLRVFASQ
jgi:GntR family transcriptional regulator